MWSSADRRALAFALGGLVALAATASAAVAPPAPKRGVRTWPAVGGQGTTFLVRFTSPGPDRGPGAGAYELVLRGPARTPCAGTLVGAEMVSFATGPATFRLGPRARFTTGAPNALGYRPVRAWCPGLYTGSVTFARHDEAGAPQTIGHVSFQVRRTRSGAAGRGGREPRYPGGRAW